MGRRKGSIPWNRGIPHSEETRRKIGERHRGRKVPWIEGKHLSEKTKLKLSNANRGHVAWNKGIPHSEETKKKIRDAKLGIPSILKGRHPSEETKRKMSIFHADFSKENHPLWRKHHSKETKQKMRRAKLGISLSEEHKRKISISQTGMHLGDKNPAWNGGTSFLPYPPEFNNELKQFIMNRDNGECQNPYCNCKAKRLSVHHIDHNKNSCSQFNLITLCTSCNVKANYGDRRSWRIFYRKIMWSKY